MATFTAMKPFYETTSEPVCQRKLHAPTLPSSRDPLAYSQGLRPQAACAPDSVLSGGPLASPCTITQTDADAVHCHAHASGSANSTRRQHALVPRLQPDHEPRTRIRTAQSPAHRLQLQLQFAVCNCSLQFAIAPLACFCAAIPLPTLCRGGAVPNDASDRSELARLLAR